MFEITHKPQLQAELIGRNPLTFYSAVISHAYYSIFFAAKAYLEAQGITTSPPREHEQVYSRFKWFVETGVLDKELLRIYDDELVKAETLLDILKDEKRKRGKFTYRKLPQANKKPAEESIANALQFFKHMTSLCDS